MQLDIGAWMYAGASDAGTSKLREILQNTESDVRRLQQTEIRGELSRQVRALREGIKKSAPKDGFLDEIAPLLMNAQAEQVALLRSETEGVVTQEQSLLADVKRAEVRIKDLEAQRGVEAEALKSEQQRLSEIKEEASRARRERDRLKKEAQQHEALVVQIEG
ncbi:hypothetical protein CKM354_001206800 [Cercospora kikuchii]|uniref:Uncharacterized protein n=1 Tax=Cercospora kikuchii TaxID=84275 RepID=A0A9P3CWK9_9PEZI|nr:uncharacterized protein CKM354_001206800 [Cercospora kikuchii]GIZ49027.1 hypothetical protein CKM354_001206800 [Cercospora kikuchii]